MDLEAKRFFFLASRVTERETIGPSVARRKGRGLAFMTEAVGGKVVRSEERVWRLCARFGKKGPRCRGK